MKYEKILQKGNYALILRKVYLDEYAVVHGLNEETGEWNHTVHYWNFGKYSQLSQVEALQRALDLFRVKTEENYINRYRLEELASKFVDGLIQDDEESAIEYFTEECELEDYEMEFFGIETESEDDENA